jgi:chaperonin GroEL
MTTRRSASTSCAGIIGKLLEGEDFNRGFDAQSGEYVDMSKAGIIDRTKVDRRQGSSPYRSS